MTLFEESVTQMATSIVRLGSVFGALCSDMGRKHGREKQKGLGSSPKPLCRPGTAQSMAGNIVRPGRQYKDRLHYIEIQGIKGLKSEPFQVMISLTHPPRLSGFDRDAQPWRVFYARDFAAAYLRHLHHRDAG